MARALTASMSSRAGACAAISAAGVSKVYSTTILCAMSTAQRSGHRRASPFMLRAQDSLNAHFYVCLISCLPTVVMVRTLCMLLSVIDQCAGVLCLNGGTCASVPADVTAGVAAGFRCRCSEGFTGTFCESGELRPWTSTYVS